MMKNARVVKNLSMRETVSGTVYDYIVEEDETYDDEFGELDSEEFFAQYAKHTK